MFLQRLRVTVEPGSQPVPIAWLDSFAMRSFTGPSRFDDTLPVRDGLLEAGLHVPLEPLRIAMAAWFRRKGWLRDEQSLEFDNASLTASKQGRGAACNSRDLEFL